MECAKGGDEMDKEKYYKANKLSEAIERQKECLTLIERLRKEHRENEPLHITDSYECFQISDELETPILDLLADYHNNILSKLEKEFDEL